MFKRTTLMVVVGFVLAAAAPSAQAAPLTLFYDNFDGGTGNLNGTTPDTTTGGAKWVAVNGSNSDFNADGSFVGGGTNNTRGGSATLAFTPASGLIYTLDASLTNVTGDTNWIALGFANGQNSGASTNNRFITGNVVGTAWMLFRGTNPNPNASHLGTGQLGTGNYGLSSSVEWPALNDSGGDIDMRIVLDTTGGAGAWTATWYGKRPADGSYTLLRATESVLDESNFSSVGFAVSSGVISGTIESFTLTSDVPEPATATLLLLGAGWLASRRKSKP